MLRTITLSVLVFVSVVVMLPFASTTAHGIRQSSVARHHRQYRRHSRAWWRRHRAHMRRRRAALAHRNAPLVMALPQPGAAALGVGNTSAVVLPKLPVGWNSLPTAKNGELRFQTDTPKGAVAGQASLSVVALSRPNPAFLTSREQRKFLAGISISDLRRTVIDKMLVTGGWVTNDYERNVSGARVLVVSAQTPNDGRSPDKAWNFYFTEIAGRIYSLTTNAPLNSSERMSTEAEQFITSLHAASRTATSPVNR
jgi:hypothetical protein